ncbi:MAG: DUF202 domain-containing protein [archaeon]|nr:DUF202 domain-containing protein [Nanoarchaeota archaeon]
MKKAQNEHSKLTHLAQKRTELAQERTILAYIRAAATVTLFGIAFFGLSVKRWDFFFFSGLFAVFVGVIFLVVAAFRWIKHSREIGEIEDLLHRN